MIEYNNGVQSIKYAPSSDVKSGIAAISDQFRTLDQREENGEKN